MPPGETFPAVMARAIRAARMGPPVQVLQELVFHPADLPSAARRAARKRPDVAVIEAVGWPAAHGRHPIDLSRLPAGVRSAYDRIRHFRRAATVAVASRPDAASQISRVNRQLTSLASGPLRLLLRRLPRPSIAEYEVALEDAVRHLRGTGTTVVVQGPGAFNDACAIPGVVSNVTEIYRSVHTMAFQVAERTGALFVDRLTATPLSTDRFYLKGQIRPSPAGHLVWGELLAEELLRAGLV